MSLISLSRRTFRGLKVLKLAKSAWLTVLLCFSGQAIDLTWPDLNTISYNGSQQAKQPGSLENPSETTGCPLLSYCTLGEYCRSFYRKWSFVYTPESNQCVHGIQWFNCCGPSQSGLCEAERHDSRLCCHFQVCKTIFFLCIEYILHPPLSSLIEPYDAPGVQRVAEEVQWVAQTGVFCSEK